MKESVPVLCAANSAYVMPLCVMLASVVTHFDPERPLALHVIANGFTDANREQVRETLAMNRPGLKNIELIWHRVDPGALKDGFPSHRRITADALSRLFAPFLLPDLKRLLYLDCDLVVLADLSELYDSITDDAILHAVHEVAVPYVSSRHGIADYEARGLRAEACIFNSGVLHINLDRWKRENISQRAFDFLRHQPPVVFFMDQAALNVVLADQWKPISHRWNQSWTILFPEKWTSTGSSQEDWRDAFEHPNVIHYAGDNKPWNRNHFGPRSSFFFKFLKRTSFRGTVRKGSAALIEGVVGYRAYFHLWRLARQVLHLFWERDKEPDKVTLGSNTFSTQASPSAPEEDVHVLCAANSSYVMPLCVMLASLLNNFNLARRLVIHIIQRDLTEKELEKVNSTVASNKENRNVTLVWHPMDRSLLASTLPSHVRISSDALSRLSAPTLFPDLGHLLYLDCDLVILSDISFLYDLPFDNETAIYAVQEVSIPFARSERGILDYEERGVSPDAPLFNSGVMVINLDYWRAQKVAQQSIAYLERFLERAFLDQGALNAVLAGRWKRLDHTWNQSWTILFPQFWTVLGYPLEQWRRAFLHPNIIHYAGDDKPWSKGNFAPRASFFFHYLKQTSFCGTVEKSLAATLEGLIGFRAYYFIWSYSRHLACWIRNKPFDQP